MVKAPNLAQLEWMVHGFGTRTSEYPPGIITLRQIHSCVVWEASHMSDGVSDEVVAEGDALVSRIPGVLVGIRTADCVPILIADPVTRAVAAIHAGWRGTAGGMVAAAIRTICANGTSRPGDLIAAIGPFALGKLASVVYADLPAPEPLRYAGLTMCSVFILGLIVLPFLPETKDKPLPE